MAEDLVDQLVLDPTLVGQAIEDPTTNHEVKAEHDRVVALGGWGVPTLSSTTPMLCLGRSSSIRPPVQPHYVSGNRWGWLDFQFYEIQHPKGREDLRAIETAFRPYLEARDWVSIQKETP